MSNSSIIVDKYAKAAFGLAKKANITEIFVRDFATFCQNIENSIKEITNPTISKSQLELIVRDICKKLSLNSNLEDFLVKLAQSRRLGVAGKIQKKLDILVKKDNKILQVELILAQKSSIEQLEEFKNLLQKSYPQNKIEINEIINKEILGGSVIKIGSVIIDSSIKNQLSNIYAEAKSAIN